MHLVVGSVCVCVCVKCVQCLWSCNWQCAPSKQTEDWGCEDASVFFFLFFSFVICLFEDWGLRTCLFLFFMFEDWELGRRPALNPWDYLTVLRVALYTWQLNIIQAHIAFQKFNWYNLRSLRLHSLILEECKVFCCWNLFKLVYIVWPACWQPVQRRYQVAPIWGQFNDPVSTSWRVS